MSKLKVNTIRHTGASSDAITLASNGTCTAKVTNNLSHRNLIINGAMQVNQRVSTSGLDDFNVVTGTLYTLDRWRAVGSSSFDWDSARVKQVSDSPDEFSNSLRVDIGNTETPSGGQNGLIHQYIEAQNLQHLAYGTSSAKSCTLSFWVRSNKTGTYCAQISHHDAGKYLLYEYSISSANTWEKKTITFSGNTSDAIANDNGIGLEISFLLTSGPDDHVSATSSWTAKPGGGGGSKYLATSNQVNLWDHADNVWYLTGVQLEVGDTATDFEMRPYGEELTKCQRYYQQFMYGTQTWVYCEGNAGQYKWIYADHGPMRTTPTVGLGYLPTGSATAAGGNGTISSYTNAGQAGVGTTDSGGRVSIRTTWSAAWGSDYSLRHTDGLDDKYVTFAAEL